MVFAVQLAKAQVRIGVGIGYPAPYYRPYRHVVVERPYGYYYSPAYAHPYVYGGYYERPVYGRPYYRGRAVYRRHW